MTWPSRLEKLWPFVVNVTASALKKPARSVMSSLRDSGLTHNFLNISLSPSIAGLLAYSVRTLDLAIWIYSDLSQLQICSKLVPLKVIDYWMGLPLYRIPLSQRLCGPPAHAIKSIDWRSNFLLRFCLSEVGSCPLR